MNEVHGSGNVLPGESKPDVNPPVTGKPPANPFENSFLSLDDLVDLVSVPLSRVAFGRSGDKGDVANIGALQDERELHDSLPGIVCRKPELYPVVGAQVTAEVCNAIRVRSALSHSGQRVQAYMPHLLKGIVARYQLPGINGYNFVCTKSLDSGGASSLNMDRQGKCYAQILLDMPVMVPRKLIGTSRL